MMIVKVSLAVSALFAAPVMAGSKKHKGSKSVKISEHLSKELSAKKAAMEVNSLGELGKHDVALSAPVGHHHKKASFVSLETAEPAECIKLYSDNEAKWKEACGLVDTNGTQALKDEKKKKEDAIKAKTTDATSGTTALCTNEGTTIKAVEADGADLLKWCGENNKKDMTMIYAGVGVAVVILGGGAFYMSQQKPAEEAY